MDLSKHFTLEEMTRSLTAKRLGIDNTPRADVFANGKALVNDVLEPLRIKYGKPIIISSGYRCIKLNAAVGGVPNSDHRFFAAADIHSLSDTLEDNMELWNVLCSMVENGEIKVRQYIFEYGKKNVGPDWIHVSINHSSKKYKNNEKLFISK